MSEQEDNGLTLEGLAQRLEALERTEAGTGQTGEEPAPYAPASMVNLEQAQWRGALEREELARRLTVLERENASLRREVASLRGPRTGIFGSLLRDLSGQNLLQARGATSFGGTTYFDVVEANWVFTGRSQMSHHGVEGYAYTNHLEGPGIGVFGRGTYGGRDPSNASPIDHPQGYGVWGIGGFGVFGRGEAGESGETRDTVGVKGTGHTGVGHLP